jgi:hypothetical protein
MRSRQQKKHVKSGFTQLLQDASEETPVMVLESITAAGFMQYLQALRHPVTGARLSKSAYGNKRSALFHMFCLHTGMGFPKEFEHELGNLMKGFFRIMAEECQDGQGDMREGKEPMTCELYHLLCTWFVEMGTQDAMFAHCFLVLTWNLMCRANNTSRICMSHLQWFNDAMRIFFANTKTDQQGNQQAKYPRHIYANPGDWVVCPIFALAMYLTSFNTPLDNNSHLFPGKNQFKRFSRLLRDCLMAHEMDLLEIGIRWQDIGTHSIRKGAATYASSSPGGPSAASISVRAGWTMGRVRNIYIRYEAGGDMFVGRCLACLPLLLAEFSASPAHFVRTQGLAHNFVDGVSAIWIQTTKRAIYPMLVDIPLLGSILEHCLASLIYNRAIVESWDAMHVVQTSTLFRVAGLGLAQASPFVKIVYPWSAGAADQPFSGIPPHVAVLAT